MTNENIENTKSTEQPEKKKPKQPRPGYRMKTLELPEHLLERLVLAQHKQAQLEDSQGKGWRRVTGTEIIEAALEAELSKREAEFKKAGI